MSTSLLVFGIMFMIGLLVQGRLSQDLIEHPIWRELLQSSTDSVIDIPGSDYRTALPKAGPIKGWLLLDKSPIPLDMPRALANLSPGYYSEDDLEKSRLEGIISMLTPRTDSALQKLSIEERNYSALVTPISGGKLVMAVDLTGLENKQNRSVQISAAFIIVNLLMIVAVIWWLYISLSQPVKDLANKMRQLDPQRPSQRVAMIYGKNELSTIAGEVNAHLGRVERLIERERSLLDQASHEFRTPLAVISGAADVLRKLDLPERCERPLARITEAVATLTQIMEALLYLSREPTAAQSEEVTVLHGLLPQLVNDHRYLIANKPVTYVLGTIEPLILRSPESMVRIAVGNLLRNAAQHTHEGEITVSIIDGRLEIRDSGQGFDTVESAKRYTESLKHSVKPGGGGGLGLFLTRRICDRFDWSFTLESSILNGTSAVIDFNRSDNA